MPFPSATPTANGFMQWRQGSLFTKGSIHNPPSTISSPPRPGALRRDQGSGGNRSFVKVSTLQFPCRAPWACKMSLKRAVCENMSGAHSRPSLAYPKTSLVQALHFICAFWKSCFFCGTCGPVRFPVGSNNSSGVSEVNCQSSAKLLASCTQNTFEELLDQCAQWWTDLFRDSPAGLSLKPPKL